MTNDQAPIKLQPCYATNALDAALNELATADSRARDFEAAASWKPRDIGDVMPDHTIYLGISPSYGRRLYVTPQDEAYDISLARAFEVASLRNTSLPIHGKYNDWRVPTLPELQHLFAHRLGIMPPHTTGAYLCSATASPGLGFLLDFPIGRVRMLEQRKLLGRLRLVRG